MNRLVLSLVACCLVTSGAASGRGDAPKQPVAAAAPAVAPPEAPPRIVHFPKDHSLGTVEAIADGTLNGLTTLGEARGDVAVPEGKSLRLNLYSAAGQDLSGLAALRPDDLYGLAISSEESLNSCLPYLASLRGLKAVWLSSSSASQKDTGVWERGLSRLRELPALEYLDLWGTATDAGLTYVAQMRSLRWLHDLGDRVTNAGLAQLAALPNLEDLQIRGKRTQINDAGLACLANFPRLRTLEFFEAPSITNAGLANLKNVHSLTSLSLSWFSINDMGFRNLSEISQLESLTVFPAKPTVQAVAQLKKLRMLKSLSICGPLGTYGGPNVIPFHFTDEYFNELKEMKSLEYLSLEPAGLTDRSASYLSQLPKLKTCTLRGSITDAGVREIAKLPNLEGVTIGSWYRMPCRIMDDGIKTLATIPRLRVLCLDGITITDASLGELAKATQLEDLHLNYRGSLRGLSQLNSLSHLKRLDVFLHDAYDGPLDLSGLSELQYLSLSTTLVSKNGSWDKYWFSDEDLQCLANIKHLTWLWLGGNLNFTDDGIANLAGLTSLQSLRIGGPELTDRGLSHLAGMKGLWSLSIMSGRFTDQSLRYLEPLTAMVRLEFPEGTRFSPAAIARLHQRLPLVAGPTLGRLARTQGQ